ncbi:MAG: hypothetical protein KAJ39_00345 [Gammaproteobacteria bacterium]|nr:hypothetical protein [Gammaproteobacteria bacterium]
MGEIISYSLSDFILFSDKAYYRQFELYNNAIWPLHLIAIIFSLVIIYALWKKPAWAGRLNAVLLAVSWVWVAWAFLFELFYQIHVVANWYALGFVLQAGLITWYGIIKNQFALFVQSQLRINIGLVLLFVSLIIYPFIAFITGRSWLQFEMFSLTPDPTVLATLAILYLCKVSSVLYVVPIIWLLISGVTLIVM